MSEEAAHPVGDGEAGSEATPAADQPTAHDQEAAHDQKPAPDQAPPQDQPRPGITRGRRILVNVVIVLATVLAVVAMLSVYANRLVFNPDNWEKASTQLLQNSDVRSTTANYLVDQLYANVNVAGLLKSSLPPRLQPLAGPAAGALRNGAVQATELALTRPVVQNLWAKANRAADQAFIAVVNGGTKHVGVNQGVVTLNLAAILDQIASRLGLSSSVVAKLPPNVAHLTILKSDQLKSVQSIGKAIRHLALWLTIIVPLLYAGAIALSRGRRRRALMAVGFSLVLAGLLGVAGRKLLENNVTNALVSDASLRPAVRATMRISTSLLGEIATAFILVGAVFVVAAWFAGPARLATVTRRAMAPFLRDRPVATFAIATGILVLIFIWDPIPATGNPVGIIVFLVLGLFGTEMLRRQTAQEFPDARSGEATAAIRERWRSIRGRDGSRSGDADSEAASLPDELERLAALQRDGAITGDEYEAAKARLLHA